MKPEKMQRVKRVMSGSILLLGCLVPPTGAAVPGLPVAASAIGEMGIDRAGNLWILDESADEVIFPGTDRIFPVPAQRGLDADLEWGVVGVDVQGKTLSIVPPSGEPTTLALEEEANDVVWLDRGTVAVSTTRADHWVEILSLPGGEVLATAIPDEPVVLATPGAVFLRSVRLAYDADSGMLWGLESVEGEVVGFEQGGEIRRRASVPAQRRDELEEWLAGVGAKARAEGKFQAPLFRVLNLALDADGDVWIVVACDPSRHEARIAELPKDQGGLRFFDLHLSSPCCSNLFTVQSRRLLFAHSADETGGCYSEHDLPARTPAPGSPETEELGR